jgi:hypothetical protein
MSKLSRRTLCFSLPGLAVIAGRSTAAEAPEVKIEPGDGALRILVGGKPFARYVFRDAKIPRPYFCDVREPGGFQVTRNYPPVAGKDPVDHDTFHPGLWLAFGDLNGADFWRNQARVEHERFPSPPRSGPGEGSFSVFNRYLAADGGVICRETTRFTVLARAGGTLLVYHSTFAAGSGGLAFGDQEEMGLGVRVATPITVKSGGKITNAQGDVNEKEVRGKPTAWCDYSGKVEGRRVGIALLNDPKLFRPAWMHARDYGLLVSNPFGRNALTGGEKSSVSVKAGERFSLRFGIYVYGEDAGKAVDLPAVYKDLSALSMEPDR